MAVRLKDIAHDVGVSTMTVSKVLRGNADIGEATRARVLARMRELNYQPNMMARALASGHSKTVGLVVPDLVHPFFAEFAKSLGGVLRESGFALVLASSEEDPQIERSEIRTLANRGMDAILVASCQPYTMERPFEGLGEVRLLLIDRRFKAVVTDFIGSDDLMAGRMATEHLIRLGRKHIAHIGGKDSSPSVDRLHGYRQAFAAAKMPVSQHLVVACERFEETGDKAGYQAMKELLTGKTLPDAVFCYNDLSAIGAMQAAMDAGFSIPGDIAFVGCGNLRYAPYLKVPLTSIDHSTDMMGMLAGKLVLDWSKDLARLVENKPRTTLLEPKLVVRQSSVAQPGNEFRPVGDTPAARRRR